MIVGLFAVTWVVALGIWHFGDIEGRWDRAADLARAEATSIAGSSQAFDTAASYASGPVPEAE